MICTACGMDLPERVLNEDVSYLGTRKSDSAEVTITYRAGTSVVDPETIEAHAVAVHYEPAVSVR